MNVNGKLYSTVYGYPCSLQIDPVEKKPLYHYYPGKKILSFGTYGCNIFCKGCQNFDITKVTLIKVMALPSGVVTWASNSQCCMRTSERGRLPSFPATPKDLIAQEDRPPSALAPRPGATVPWRMRWTPRILALGLLSMGCGGGGLPVLPLTGEPTTTLQAVWEPLTPPAETLAAMDAGALSLHNHAAFAAAGLGVRLGPGRPWQERRELAPDFAPPAPRALAGAWPTCGRRPCPGESTRSPPSGWRPSTSSTARTATSRPRSGTPTCRPPAA